jgi:hypothetical protein
MKVLKAVWVVVAAWMFTGCGAGLEAENPAGAPAAEASLIVPGQGLTELKLGDPYSKATGLYGPGIHSWMSMNEVYSHRMDYFDVGLSLRFSNNQESLSPESKIAAIELFGPSKRKTDVGIGLGSTLEEVKAAYGNPTKTSFFFGDIYENGLAIEHENGIVTRIVIK